MNAQHFAQDTDGMLLAMRVDERVPHFASLAKYAVAFFKMSRSSVTRANSFFSRLTSASWSVCL
jgi:hypothetical protein